MFRRVLILIALLGLLCQSFGAVVATWMCEGKACSTSVTQCCCTATLDRRHNECSTAKVSGKSCAGKCGCKLSVKSVSPATTAPLKQRGDFTIPVVELPAILPESFHLPASWVLSYAPVLSNPPPTVSAPPLLDGAPLRAPPAPFV